MTTGTNDIGEARLLEALADATAFYRTILLRHPEAAGPRRYLTHRRLEHVLDAASRWHVGYAQPGLTDLLEHLRGRGHHDQVLLDAGLAMRARTGRLVDVFRRRIVVPVRRHDDGQVVGFVGRAAPSAGPDTPRYLNTPETTLYRKGRLLLGLTEQAAQLAAGVTPALVEGPFDVLAVAGSGAQLAPVSPCGTALTSHHVESLVDVSGHSRGVLVATDNDTAGHAAAIAAYVLLSARFGPLHALNLPDGADPADLGQRDGMRALGAHLDDPANRRQLLDLVVDAQLTEHSGAGFLEHRVTAMRKAARLLADVDPAEAVQQSMRIARLLGLDPYTVTEAVAEAIQAQRRLGPRHSRPNHANSQSSDILALSAE